MRKLYAQNEFSLPCFPSATILLGLQNGNNSKKELVLLYVLF